MVLVTEGIGAALVAQGSSAHRPARSSDVILDGRDAVLTNNLPVTAANGTSLAQQVTDDADGCPYSPNPDYGKEDGIEVVLGFGCRFGDGGSFTYIDDSPYTTARIWTKFPSPPTVAEYNADLSDITNTFLPGGSNGCTDASSTYFDEAGMFRCNTNQTLRQLFLRAAGFRAQTKRAWANWTSRKLRLNPGGSFTNSFVMKLFNDAITGHPSNVNAATNDDVYAEGFIQYAAYDWYTLMGRFDKGTIASPGGIPIKFSEWTQNRTMAPPGPICTDPTTGLPVPPDHPDYRPIPPQPIVPVTDDPYD